MEKAERSDIPDIDKKKYLVPADLTVGQFVYVVRKRIKLSAEKAIFIFVKNILPPTAAMMSAIYEENKDEDGFLYMTYSGENTFGSLWFSEVLAVIEIYVNTIMTLWKYAEICKFSVIRLVLSFLFYLSPHLTLPISYLDVYASL